MAPLSRRNLIIAIVAIVVLSFYLLGDLFSSSEKYPPLPVTYNHLTTTLCSKYPHVCTCEARDPSILIYNRLVVV